MAEWFEARREQWGLGAPLMPKPTFVLGMDEVGYGAYAGPLTLGAVLAPTDWTHEGLKDSKAFSGKNKELRRASVLQKLSHTDYVSFYLLRIAPEWVDRAGVYKARTEGFVQLLRYFAGANLLPSTLVVVDGDINFMDACPGATIVSLPKADTVVPHVMAASILAKVHRDTEMMTVSPHYPQYFFASNKGYGSDPKHQEALKTFGPCPIHRRSYKPILELLESTILRHNATLHTSKQATLYSQT